ncbi:relaxase/mobilization nuclease domain-containing protein [Burkholderia pseudomallei]|uniref:relaxase/mobilization nuclease domain-containing protein n=1 Tax=Burkholderia pseudomallei TaxID=28450 RepID=UPI0009781C30|nr:relaxase/mobilization nuclease domain-containing protein [Burkholderia pseudomallei]
MMIKIFHRSQKLSAVGPVQYLLSDRDHTKAVRSVKPEILAGDPAVTDCLIESLPFKHRYVAGCLAFRPNEQPTDEQKHHAMARFEQCFLAGLTPDRYNILWVEHRDKGRIELNFVVPRVELSTHKSMNIHPSGAKNLAFYNAFVSIMNNEFGYEQVVPNPTRLRESEHISKINAQAIRDNVDIDSGTHASKLKWHANLVRKIHVGKIRNRPELIEYLREHGCEFSRIGSDYVSIKNKKNGRAIRFRGYIYEDNGGKNYQLDCIGNAILTPQHANLLRAKLDKFTAERAQFNRSTFAHSRRTTFRRIAGEAIHSRIALSRPMLGQIVQQKSAEILAPYAEHRIGEMPSTSRIGTRPQTPAVNKDASMGSSTRPHRAPSVSESAGPAAGAPSSALTDTASIEIEIGRLETQLAVAGAKGDAERASKLQRQIVALHAQIAEIRRRAGINEQERRLAKLNASQPRASLKF